MSTGIAIPEPVIAQVEGSGDGFPVRRVFCVGRNYADHAREMGGDPDREPPFFFTKWAETVVPSGSVIPYPQGTSDFHFEAELVVAIGKGGRDLTPEQSLGHVHGYAAGLDMTRRDLQREARGAGRPWDTAKNVEKGSPLGVIRPANAAGAMSRGDIRMLVNGEVRQHSDLSCLIWPVADVISFLSRLYRIEPGDLIYTGTPSGVGPVVEGDRLRVEIGDLAPLDVTIGGAAE
ncbi:fumarylacetoacetate hydrolase family protein [Parvularcula oceani]|uniref:fumarylacetoacetate hydrolase family protein n=1 Tax=Parvularcula oceani TaxID=1247963 RepID=UPI0004E1B93A|nr:fumarylacetoacetate hydrolase family protein [Parvularcula oceani]